ncbi:MAG: AAA family ATPase [Gammaproteobacteria bacterium]|nr:AAA family ATPase [Gammaproteobacteria bacterium]
MPRAPNSQRANDADAAARLIEALRNPSCFAHEVSGLELLETHISWVLLTGPYAYKMKKPVKLPFLDFSTLARRRECCAEELRINRRLAPELYLAVVPITGTADAPVMGGDGEAIEYAVQMVQFPGDARLDGVADRGELGEPALRRFAARMAAFHADVDMAPEDSPFAGAEEQRRDVLDNFAALADSPLAAPVRDELEEIERFSRASLERLGRRFAERKRDGFVRECHGDLHLANLALIDGEITAFDAIEFNEAFRWVDVMNEIAFLVMDLDYHRLAHLARLFLNHYLEHTGDYAGLDLLAHYRVYRAMVRAKVAAIRARQCEPDTPAHSAARDKLLGHVALAHARLAGPARTSLVITHGFSGSGKSWLSERLAMHCDAVRVRSDAERKRPGAQADGDLYGAAATERTYGAVAAGVRAAITAGYPAIADATFLDRRRREQFRALADELGVPFHILDLRAPRELLEARVARRTSERSDISDADLQVLARQLAAAEPLGEDELGCAVAVDVAAGDDMDDVARGLLARGTAGLAPDAMAGRG